MNPLYTIKGLKQWQGMDGSGCHGEVTGPDGICCSFRDDGNGGGMWTEAPYDHKTKTHNHDAFNAFKVWANAHPILAITWEQWGFTPGGLHQGQVIEWLLVEDAVAKEVKKGYLCYQEGDDPYSYCGAKQGRKKMKHTTENVAWLKGQLPNCIVRNEETPSWITEEVSA